MGVLAWEKPAKVKSTQAWKEDYGFEDGPAGGYQPNMSAKDQQTWKAKLTGHTKGFPQVEIRKTLLNGVQLTIIVNLGDGYTYKGHKPRSEKYEGKTPADFPRWAMTQDEIDLRAARDSTQGIHVHMAMNGGGQLLFQDIADLNSAILEAKAFLEALPPK